MSPRVICTRYIHRELLQKLFWSTIVLLLVVSSQRLVRFLGDVLAGSLPADKVFAVLGCKILASAPKLLPALLMLAVLFAFLRMKRDRELMAMASAGLGLSYQLAVVLRFAAGYCLLAVLCGAWLAPLAERKLQTLLREARQEVSVSAINSGQFRRLGPNVVHVQDVLADRQGMEQVFLHVARSPERVVLRSESARFDYRAASNRRYIVFHNGRRYIGEPGSQHYQISHFARYGVLLEQAALAGAGHNRKSVFFSGLLGRSAPEYAAERHWRAALVLACPLLALFVLLTVHAWPGERYMLPTLIVILVYMIYSNALAIGARLLQRQSIAAEMGLWWVHLALLAGIFWLLYLLLFRNRRPPPLPDQS